MQISKYLPAICAAVFCAGFISAHADDSQTQAAARAALEAKMNALDAQQIQSNNQNSSVLIKPAAGMQTGSGDTSQAERALHEKMAELNASASNVQMAAPAPKPPAKARVAAKKPAASAPPIFAPFAPMPAKPVAPEAMRAPEKPLNPANVNYPGKELGLKLMEAPSLPVSAEVRARLQMLDAKYLAGQITPEEYHKQRAEIMGRP
jgi:hypothetical protein